MARSGPEVFARKKNVRLGLFLASIFLVLYAGSVVFILVSHLDVSREAACGRGVTCPAGKL